MSTSARRKCSKAYPVLSGASGTFCNSNLRSYVLFKGADLDDDGDELSKRTHIASKIRDEFRGVRVSSHAGQTCDIVTLCNKHQFSIHT